MPDNTTATAAPETAAFPGAFEKQSLLADYRLACESREASLSGRKEVFMGKAKFGIFGDGKELAQIAMAKAFKNGDFRSGYYRDQTFMFAIGQLTLEQFFAQLYAHPDLEAEPGSAGRSMTSHFATHSLDENGQWVRLTEQKNSSADISPTASQMSRLVGLAYASKLYRNLEALHRYDGFSVQGDEIAFGTIGNASCAEGVFFEAINAAAVLQAPMLTSVWDDGYGISVPNSYQIAKSDVSAVLSGFQRKEKGETGCEILEAKGWDYPGLLDAYARAERFCRDEHVPVLLHVREMTQPQGHSTSGSHERYKSKDRLAWEQDHDCIARFGQFIVENGYASQEEIDKVAQEAKDRVKQARTDAWKAFQKPILEERKEALGLIAEAAKRSANASRVNELHETLKKEPNPLRNDAVKAARQTLFLTRDDQAAAEARQALKSWLDEINAKAEEMYDSHQHSQSEEAATNVGRVAPEYAEDAETLDGWQIMQAAFDDILAREPRAFAIGEDVGKIGDVNQGFKGLQEKHGELRVTDTGIRENTIIGQGIGAALRGLRPIVEIQYLDYVFYAIQILSDDLACLHYRTKGRQKAPLIVRTRGHRLEGIWHAGSPMGALLSMLRGMHVLVPRDMTKAAAFYNTLLKSDEPAIVVECLNGYRLKEKLPANIGEMTEPLGIPETIREGADVTVVTYGSMCRVVMAAADTLAGLGVECEVIDAQTLLPFDRNHLIVDSVKKTNRLAVADEDMPGGATAFMLQHILDEQNAYRWLDSKPIAIAAKPHRPAYASDGDYFSKPSVEDVVERVYALMHEADPQAYPAL